MRSFNIIEISDTSRFTIGLAGAIGLGIMPFFLFSILETFVLSIIMSLTFSTLLFTALMYWIFPDMSVSRRFNVMELFLFGPVLLLYTGLNAAHILEMEVSFSLFVPLVFYWFFNNLFVLGAFLMLIGFLEKRSAKKAILACH